MATVLIVDDEERFRSECSRYFTMMGWQAYTAPDGERAIAFLQQQGHTVDAMIVDRNMPGMSGDEVIARLYQDHGLSDMCVVMLTAYSDYESAVETLQAGAWQYLSKPIPLDALLALLAPGVALKKCHKMRRQILAAGTLNEVIETIRGVIRDTVAPEYCRIIFLPEPHAVGVTANAHKDAEHAFINVLRQGRPYVIEQELNAVEKLGPVIEGAGSLIAVPVFKGDGEIIGVLDLESRVEKAFSMRWIEVLRYCADLIGTSETVRAALVNEIALINREVHHRLATSVHILAQQTKEAQRAKRKKEPVDSPLNVISRHVGIVSSVMDDLREITRKKRPLQIAEVALYDVLCQVIGMAHGLGKPVVLFRNAGDAELPAELLGLDLLQYHDELDLAMKLYWGLEWKGSR